MSEARTACGAGDGSGAGELDSAFSGEPSYCHQVTTLDRAKLTQRIGTLPSEILDELAAGLKSAMDLD